MKQLGIAAIRKILILYWLAIALASHWPYLSLAPNDIIPFGLDKWLHFFCYAILAALIIASAVTRLKYTLPIIIAVAYSIIDESTQALIPGRTFSLLDILASNLGIILGSSSYALTIFLKSPANSFIHHARLVSAITLLSRCFGLVRDWALAFAFGFTDIYSSWVVAFMIPNLFRRLFGEGALSAAFIPHFTKLSRDDTQTAKRFAALVLTSLFTFLIIIAALITFIIAILLATNTISTKWLLAAKLTTITAWYAPLVCVVAILGSMLQVRGRFGTPAAVSIIVNIFIIVASLYVVFSSHITSPQTGAAIVAASLLLAGFTQIAWQWLALKHDGIGKLNFRFAQLTPDSPLRIASTQLFKQWAPTVIGLAVFQINVLLDVLIAMSFSSKDPTATFSFLNHQLAYPMREGAAAVLGATSRLFQFPLGVFGIAIATAIFPAISAATNDKQLFSKLIKQGLRLTLYIALPASVGLILIRHPLTNAIYAQAGQITATDASRIAHVLIGYAPAVWAYSMIQLLTRAFYAHHNPITPMRLSLAMLLLNLILNLTMIWPFGIAGLAYSTAITATLQCIILLFLVRRYVHQPIDKTVRKSWLQTITITTIMLLIIISLLSLFDLQITTRQHAIIALAAITTLAIAIYFIASKLIKMPELTWLLSRSTTPPSTPPSNFNT